MSNILRAASGQQTETEENTGPNSYVSGTGFSIRSNLGRVDRATVDTDQNDWEARVDSISDNNAIVVKVYSQSTGVEAPDDEDFSSDTFTTSAERL